MENPFVAITPSCRMVPVVKIFPRETPDPMRVQRALVLMAAAAQGVGPKRQPLAVTNREDGCYQIIDGNSTWHALLELGEREAVVEIS